MRLSYFRSEGSSRLTTGQIDEQVGAYTLILRSVQDRMSACRTRRNDLALINGLPQDLILVIFNMTVSSSKSTQLYYPRLFNLRFVCKA